MASRGGVGWLGLVFAGMAIAFTPGLPSPVVGWVLLGVAAVIALVTMDHWVKVFPGLLAFGILGTILELLDGHALNNPQVPVSRPDGAIVLLVCALGTAISVTLAKRRLRLLDRIALFAFVFCFFWQAAQPKLMRFALGIGLGMLVLAWFYNYLSGRAAHPRKDHLDELS